MAWTSREQYEQIKVLGQGGFGEAKLVKKRVGTGELYVVKEVNLDQIAKSCGNDQAFFKKVKDMTVMEAAHMMSLQHENIVRVFGSFEETIYGSSFYHIVLEYCELGDLNVAIREAAISDTPFEERQIRRWARQLASALHFLHLNEFVHRDIKPANIFLAGKRQSVKLGDFGLAKQVDQIAQKTITTIGTEAYSSPEFLRFEPYTKKADVWALGVVIYELLALTRPFGSLTGRPIGYEILHLQPNPIPSRYSSAFQDFVDLLLTKDMDKRPSMDVVVSHRTIARSKLSSSVTEISAVQQLGHVRTLSDTDRVKSAPPTGDTLSKEKVFVSPTIINKPSSANTDSKKAPSSLEKRPLPDRELARPASTTTNTPTSKPVAISPTVIRKPPPPHPRPSSEEISKVLIAPAKITASSHEIGDSTLLSKKAPANSPTTLILRKQNTFAITPATYHRKRAAKAPRDFQLTRVEKREDANPLETSRLVPENKELEEELSSYSGRSQLFQHVDKHALEVSKANHDSFRDLIWDLIYSHNIKDDFEKARALFLWLCTKDLSTIKFAETKPNTPERALLDLKYSKRAYSNIFELMCSYCELQCILIRGLAKGATYKFGMKMSTEDIACNHFWCAVLIDGKWRFIDTEWASRKVIMKQQSAVEYELDEFYFFPPPEKFIYSHFPKDPKWQLLAKPISLEEFENMPYVTSLFFKLNLEFASDSKKAIIQANEDGEAQVAIKLAKSASLNALDFAQRLEIAGDSQTSEIAMENGQKFELNQFVMQKCNYSSRKSNFTIRLPNESEFEFTVFGLSLDDLTSNQSVGETVTYSAIAVWKIKPSSISAPFERRRPFPPCTKRRWGGLTVDERLTRGISKFPQESILKADQNGMVEVVLDKSNPETFMLFTAKLFSTDDSLSEDQLAQCILTRFIDHNIKVVFLISLPAPGEFGVEIYSSKPDQKEVANQKLSLMTLCQYLLQWEESGFKGKSIIGQRLKFPILGSNYLGIQKSFETLGLKLVSHPDPYVTVANPSSGLEITLRAPRHQLISLSLDMKHCQPGKPDENCSMFTFHHFEGSKRYLRILCRFPHSGMYKLVVYAKSQTDTSKSIPCVCNYLINVGSGESGTAVPFPKQFSDWKGAYLYEPVDGHVRRFSKNDKKEMENLKVRIALPNANKVAAFVSAKYRVLFEQDRHGVWQGDVNLKEVWNVLENPSLMAIAANFDKDRPSSYSTLLEYRLFSA